MYLAILFTSSNSLVHMSTMVTRGLNRTLLSEAQVLNLEENLFCPRLVCYFAKKRNHCSKACLSMHMYAKLLIMVIQMKYICIRVL